VSIVEKAVGRARNDRQKQDLKAVSSHEPESAASKADSTSSVIHLDRAKDAGIICLKENPELAKEYRFLKRPILAKIFVQGANTASGNVIMITSDLPGAGKTFVSFNLAVSIAMEQLVRVILIDADPLRRSLTHALGQEARPGLMETLADVEVKPDQVTLDTELPNLRFIPCGQPTEYATELLASRRVTEALKAFDDPDTVVILDSAPLLLTSEAHALTERVDHTVVVIEAGRTTKSQVEMMLKRLSESSSSIGFMLNKAPISSKTKYQGYYHYY